jgi:transcriptional antiterminator NusG
MFDDENITQDDDYDPEPIYLNDTSSDDTDDDDGGIQIRLDDGSIIAGSGERHWYVVHCYSGYENKVRHAIEQRIETMGMRDKIFDVIVPTQEELEVKDGKRKAVVRNTPGVTGFVGMGNEPTPLRPEEVKQILDRMERGGVVVKVSFKIGQKVRIIDGPFNDFIGTVAAIDQDKSKVRVMVNFFGRDTPVELDFLEVEKV